MNFLKHEKPEIYVVSGIQVSAALFSINILRRLGEKLPATGTFHSPKECVGVARSIEAQSGSMFDVEPETDYSVGLKTGERTLTHNALAVVLESADTVIELGRRRAGQYSGFITYPTPPGQPPRIVSANDFHASIETHIQEQLAATQAFHRLLAGSPETA